MKKFLLFIGLFAFTASLFSQTTVTDIDGNVYNTVTIGTQIWMQENLKTSKYNDGTAITTVASAGEWVALGATPAFSWLDDDIFNIDKGAFYNWYAASSPKLCPTGWHVPEMSEFRTLMNLFGGTALAGIHMSTEDGGDNSSGFSLIITGARSAGNGFFQYTTEISRFWSATSDNETNAFYTGTNIGYTNLWDASWLKGDGNSVRCLKNSTTSIDNNGFDGIAISAYPNPVLNDLVLRVENSQSQTFSYKLYDMSGKLLLQNPITTEVTSISFSSYPSSMYLLKLSDAKSTLKTIIIVRK